MGYGLFYKNLTDLNDIEKENPDLTKPFGLFSGRISLTLNERLNVLERETVQACLKKM